MYARKKGAIFMRALPPLFCFFFDKEAFSFFFLKSVRPFTLPRANKQDTEYTLNVRTTAYSFVDVPYVFNYLSAA